MTTLQSMLLGLVQGLTEFLPISSSGHLLLITKLYNLPCDLLMIVLLHVGTLVAVLISYRQDIITLLRHPLADSRLLKLIVASVPTFLLAFVVRFLLPPTLLGGNLLPIGFALTIVLLVASRYYSPSNIDLERTNYGKIVLVGFAQGLALIPGLSRSGTTISTMKMLGVNNKDSSQFSFLLSIPIILASALGELITTDLTTVTTPWYNYAVGIALSALSGFVAIHTVKRVLKRNYWLAFAIYLLIPLTISLIIL